MRHVNGNPAAVIWRFRPNDIEAEVWLDLIAGAGILVALLVACGLGFAPLLAVCWLLYLNILLVGQTFLSFQWDIFLLEVRRYYTRFHGADSTDSVFLFGWSLNLRAEFANTQ